MADHQASVPQGNQDGPARLRVASGWPSSIKPSCLIAGGALHLGAGLPPVAARKGWRRYKHDEASLRVVRRGRGGGRADERGAWAQFRDSTAMPEHNLHRTAHEPGPSRLSTAADDKLHAEVQTGGNRDVLHLLFRHGCCCRCDHQLSASTRTVAKTASL